MVLAVLSSGAYLRKILGRTLLREEDRRTVLGAQLSQPTTDAFSAGVNPRIADALVFGECALTADRPDAYALSITLKQQTVARRTPRRRRTSRGTVICPFLVIFACFCIPVSYSLPKFSLAAGEVLSAERKISRASSSMERPCWAARTLNLPLVLSSNCSNVSVAIPNASIASTSAFLQCRRLCCS